jgi:imidazolonepropionase-like amidohydrolase
LCADSIFFLTFYPTPPALHFNVQKIQLALLAVLTTASLTAQTARPAPAQAEPVLILGAFAHLGNGTTIPNSAIAFEGGKLTLVADATTIRLDQSKYKQIYSAAGKHVYPGFVSTNTTLGLVEVDAVRSTRDHSETGSLNPNARSIIAYNTDSEVTPTVRSNGVLLAQVTPGGGVLSGTSSVVQLDAWNWEEAAIRMDDGQHLHWPNPPVGNPPADAQSTEPKPAERYARDVQAIQQLFTEGQAYVALKSPPVANPRLESLRPLFAGQQTLYLHANAPRAITEGVLWAKQLGLRCVVVGGKDSWQVTEFLKQQDVAVILHRTQSIPEHDDDDIEQPYKTAKALHEAGVRFCFSNIGSWQQRNLPFQAGQAVGSGLPYEAAVQALTLESARILGISDRYGSLEVGKSATLFISEGDALDMRTNQVTAAFIDGRSISLDNKQRELARKYEARYKRQ